ncbi:MAG: DUF167 domain-containing protein [Spirochaetota bacterium]
MISLSLKVVPNARKVHIKKEGGRLKLYVNRPPLDGKANEAVIEYFSETLDVPKRAVVIVRGETSREKQLSIDIDPAAWAAFLAAIG